MSNRVVPAGSINPNATIAPGVVIIESLTPGAIAGIPTNNIGAVGIATWGPVGAPLNNATPSNYTFNFGIPTTLKYDMGAFVNAAYLQGNVANYICVRVTDGSDTSASTALADSSSFVAAGALLTGFYTGSTGNSLQATMSTGSAPQTYTLTIGRPGYAAESFVNIVAPSAIQSFTVTAGGSGYTSVPNVVITGGGGSGAVATAVLTGPIVTSITVVSPGANYNTLPQAIIVGGGGTGATATAVLSPASGPLFWNNLVTAVNNGQSGVRGPSQLAIASLSTGIGAIVLTSGGSGYVTAPTVSFTGGGTGATAAASLGYTITGVSVTAAGSYTAVPTVTASTPGAGATFTTTAKAVSAAPVLPGSGYATSDTITLAGGTFTTASILTVNSTTLVSLAVNAGGTGYAPGDQIALAGGTASVPAIVIVDTVTSGAVVTFHIVKGGTYTVNSAALTQATTTGAGTGATFNMGLFGVYAATPTTLGSYSATPASPVSQSASSGSGTGATFTMGWGLLAIAVTAGGSGYTASSQIIVTGTGSGGTANITLASTGSVIEVVLLTTGSGYMNPTVVFSSGTASATATVGSQNLPATPASPYLFTGGTDGNAGVTGTTLLGSNSAPVPTGMYALGNANTSLFALVDCDTASTWSIQNAFGTTIGSQAIIVGPPSQTVAAGVTAKSNAGIIQNSSIYLLGDWCGYLDTNNNNIVRLISPQGFYAGIMGNLSPEQSPLNKVMNGVIYTQKSQMGQIYQDSDYVTMMQNGIEVISNPIPAGTSFGCETGKSAGLDLSTNNVNIQRMANFLALSFSRSGVIGAYIGLLQTPSVQDSARASLVSFLQSLVANQQIEAFKVVLDSTNNPNNRVVLGFMEAQITVQLFSVIIVFLIDLNVGTVTIQ